MIFLKTEDEIELMRAANQLVSKSHVELARHIKPGITTSQLDKIAEEFIRDHGALPTFKGFPNPYGSPFPASICASVNDEVVHGIPSKTRKLKNGDIVKLDFTVRKAGYESDMTRTYLVGEVDARVKEMVVDTEKAIYEGIKQVRPGARIGDVSYAIMSYAHSHGLSVVEELVGHGIGTNMHEEPDVPNYGEKNTGLVLKEGMVLAIEPMLNLGKRNVVMLDNDWTVVTEDGSPSAHFEHTVAVTRDGYEILTGE